MFLEQQSRFVTQVMMPKMLLYHRNKLHIKIENGYLNLLNITVVFTV